MSTLTEEQKKECEMINKVFDYKFACDKVFDHNPGVQHATLKAIIDAVSELRRDYNQMSPNSNYVYSVYPVERYAELIRVLKTAKTSYAQALMRRQQKDLEIINSLNDFVNDYCDLFDIEQLP
jgi:ribosomal protein L18